MIDLLGLTLPSRAFFQCPAARAADKQSETAYDAIALPRMPVFLDIVISPSQTTQPSGRHGPLYPYSTPPRLASMRGIPNMGMWNQVFPSIIH